MDSPWGRKESDRTEQLSLSLSRKRREEGNSRSLLFIGRTSTSRVGQVRLAQGGKAYGPGAGPPTHRTRDELALPNPPTMGRCLRPWECNTGLGSQIGS